MNGTRRCWRFSSSLSDMARSWICSGNAPVLQYRGKRVFVDNDGVEPYDAAPHGMAGGAFSPEELGRFDKELAQILTHYPEEQKRAAMLPALRLVRGVK